MYYLIGSLSIYNCLKISKMLNVFIIFSTQLTYFPTNIAYHFLINAAHAKKKILSPFSVSSKAAYPPLASSLDTVIIDICNFAFLSTSPRW